MNDYGLARAELQWLTPPNNEAKEETDADYENERRHHEIPESRSGFLHKRFTHKNH